MSHNSTPRSKLNPDRHFYLYAKNHYIVFDTEYDMKKIMAYRCALKEDCVSLFDTSQILLRLVWKHMRNENHFVAFVHNIKNKACILRQSMFHDMERAMTIAVIRACLSELTIVKVKDIPFDLGEADPNVLPLKQKKGE